MPILHGYFPSEEKAQEAKSVLETKGFTAELQLSGRPSVEGIDQMNNPYSGDIPLSIRGAISTDIAVAGMTNEEGIFAPPAYINLEPRDYLGYDPYRLKIEGEQHQLEEAVQVIKTYDGRI